MRSANRARNSRDTTDQCRFTSPTVTGRQVTVTGTWDLRDMLPTLGHRDVRTSGTSLVARRC
jgi:hypothetical protein